MLHLKQFSQVHEHDTVVSDLLKQTLKYLSTLLESHTFPINVFPCKSVVNFKDIKTGDHLIYECINGWCIHYYVESCDEDGSVQVRSWFLPGNDSPLVEQELFSQPDQMESMELGIRVLNKDKIDVNRLKICIDETSYISDERVKEYSVHHNTCNLLSNNSEHFITFIKTGKAECQQFKLLANAIVQQLLIRGGQYGFIPTVISAIKLRVMKLLASFFEVVSFKVVQKSIEKTTEAVDNTTLDALVVSVSEKNIDQIAKDVGADIIRALAQEICKNTDNTEAVSEEVVHNSIEVLCKEVLASIIAHLLEKNMGQDGKGIADHIANEGLDVVVKEIVTKAMEDVAKDLVKKGVIQVETDFFEHLEEEAAESAMKEILQNSKMAAVEQITHEVVSKTTSHSAYHIAKNAIKSNITVGVVVEGVFYTAGMVNAGQKYYKGEMDGDDFVEFTVEHTASSSGSLAGGIGGSIAGATAGAAVGSFVPVIGTTVGAGMGGFIGGMGGGVSGSLAGLGMGKLINWMWK